MEGMCIAQQITNEGEFFFTFEHVDYVVGKDTLEGVFTPLTLK